ncbi:MAG TPA: hypothetical protein VGR13_04880 [Actinomycetota bacterium]|jgi:hypothetical protein|nr:hypothetical protein [Actinomycetota bacterium]
MDREMRDEETTAPETEAARQAMAGLRAIWTATGQMQGEAARLECGTDGEGCSASLGFEGLEGLEGAVEPTTDTTEAIDKLRRAWKATLAREGKLHDSE